MPSTSPRPRKRPARPAATATPVTARSAVINANEYILNVA
jgi:hypothetical protein